MKKLLIWLVILIVAELVGQPGGNARSAELSPTPPPPPKATHTPAPKPTRKPKQTITPTRRPPSGGYRTPTPTGTLSMTQTIASTTTLTPTWTATATPIPGELHITVYVDANRNNLADDGEGVENLLLVASHDAWRVQAWTVQGVAVFQIPARFYDSELLVQSPYLHWGETFDAPEADASVSAGVLRLTLPDFPVFLP